MNSAAFDVPSACQTDGRPKLTYNTSQEIRLRK
jgi:hypothetical protein